jgi:hypothetical protein
MKDEGLDPRFWAAVALGKLLKQTTAATARAMAHVDTMILTPDQTPFDLGDQCRGGRGKYDDMSQQRKTRHEVSSVADRAAGIRTDSVAALESDWARMM